MKLYNTLKRTKEEFVPITDGMVKMYACGPTVYNYFHIGNARPFIVFDTIRRYLEYIGYRVEFVQNFTDIDDKMINRARQEGISVKELADKYIKEYYKDAKGLGIKRATHHPRATEHIEEIIALVETLIDKGLAYELNGDVYYDTTKFKEYGKLSHQTIEDLEAGARIEVNENKKHPMDFALWKAQKPGEPAWDSPWGRGRPGWHIECSAMAMKYLGDTIDIHGGGQDLIFPHHENEIAQSEGSTGKPFARYWIHNGYINVNNQKMSKSLGNFFTVRDISKEYDLEVVRLFMLSAHYRNPINFSKELLDQAKSALERLYNAKNNLLYLREKTAGKEIKPGEQGFIRALDEYREKFKDQMNDDFNTADALAVIFEMVREINSTITIDSSRAAVDKALGMLNELTSVLGLLTKDDNNLDDEIKKKIELREQARKEKNWSLADSIRDELLAQGIVLQDTPHGVKVVKQG